MSTNPRDALAASFSKLPLPARVAIGYSGGLDSSVLLHAAASLITEFPLELVAIHIHHHAPIEKEERLRQETANALGIPLYHRDINRDEYAVLLPEYGPEAALRVCRYRSFSAVLRKLGITLLFIGHHADDQAETVLLRLVTGDLFFLGGIPSVGNRQKISLHRPLLPCPRSALYNYAKAQGLSWSEDATNAEQRHPRNFLRHEIVPLLAARFPSLLPKLLHTADIAAQLHDWIDQRLPCWDRCDEGLFISQTEFFSLPAALRLRVLYQGIQQLTEDGFPRIRASFFAPLCTRTSSGSGVLLKGRGWKFYVKDDKLMWSRAGSAVASGYFFYCAEGEIGLTISPLRSIMYSIVNGEAHSFLTWGTVIIRSLRRGDGIQSHHREVSLRKKIMHEGLSAWQRERVPIIEDQKGIVAALVNLFDKPPIIRKQSSATESTAGNQITISVTWSNT